MTVSLKNWRAGRWWTLFTPILTHFDFDHLRNNMLGLWSCGTSIITIFGILDFLFLCVVGGAVGNVASLYVFRYAEHMRPWLGPRKPYRGIGLSGGLCAMAIVLGCKTLRDVICTGDPQSKLALSMSLSTACLGAVQALITTSTYHDSLPDFNVGHLGSSALGLMFWAVKMGCDAWFRRRARGGWE